MRGTPAWYWENICSTYSAYDNALGFYGQPHQSEKIFKLCCSKPSEYLLSKLQVKQSLQDIAFKLEPHCLFVTLNL